MTAAPRPTAIRLLTVVAVVLFGALANSASAGAHLRSGTVAVDYTASVSASRTPAYSAQIYQSDRALYLGLRAGHTVELLGYLGEPMFRLDAAGLWVNEASPTSVVAGLVPKSQRVEASTPHWRLQRGRHSVIWRDARSQGLAPGVQQGSWSVPMIVDGRTTELGGMLRRHPTPALWSWLALLGCFVITVAVLLPRRRQLAAAAISLAAIAAGASVIVAVAFALDAYASPGTWIAGFDEIFFIAIGVGALLRGPRRWHLPAAIGLGLLAAAVGISKGQIFFHPLVLAVLPGAVIRLLAIVAIGAGFAAAALAGAIYAEPAMSPRAQGSIIDALIRSER